MPSRPGCCVMALGDGLPAAGSGDPLPGAGGSGAGAKSLLGHNHDGLSIGRVCWPCGPAIDLGSAELPPPGLGGDRCKWRHCWSRSPSRARQSERAGDHRLLWAWLAAQALRHAFTAELPIVVGCRGRATSRRSAGVLTQTPAAHWRSPRPRSIQTLSTVLSIPSASQPRRLRRPGQPAGRRAGRTESRQTPDRIVRSGGTLLEIKDLQWL